MTTPNATPRPWQIGIGGKDDGKRSMRVPFDVYEIYIPHKNGPWGCIWTQHPEHARLIVEAVNSHDQLKAENAKLREALGRLLDQTAGPGSLSYDQAKKQARAALGGGK